MNEHLLNEQEYAILFVNSQRKLNSHDLLQMLIGVSLKEARTFIQRYFEEYPEIKIFMDNIIKQDRGGTLPYKKKT